MIEQGIDAPDDKNKRRKTDQRGGNSSMGVGAYDTSRGLNSSLDMSN